MFIVILYIHFLKAMIEPQKKDPTDPFLIFLLKIYVNLILTVPDVWYNPPKGIPAVAAYASLAKL